jgi:hypothetical protein
MITTHSSLFTVALANVGFLFGLGSVHADDLKDAESVQSALAQGKPVDILTSDRKDYGSPKEGSLLAQHEKVSIKRVSPNMVLIQKGLFGAHSQTAR